MSVWILSIICVGSLWCIPEHDFRYRDAFATKAACLEAGKERLPKGFPNSEIWVINCTEWSKL